MYWTGFLAVALIHLLAVVTALWFSFWPSCSVTRGRAGLARLDHWFDRLMCAVLAGLGVKLALSELR